MIVRAGDYRVGRNLHGKKEAIFISLKGGKQSSGYLTLKHAVHIERTNRSIVIGNRNLCLQIGVKKEKESNSTYLVQHHHHHIINHIFFLLPRASDALLRF